MRLLKPVSLIAFLSLSVACSDLTKPQVVPLMRHDTTQIAHKKNLVIKINQHVPDKSKFGGDNFSQQLKFTNMESWVNYHLKKLNNAPCDLNQKTEMDVTIKNLYTTLDAGFPICILTLDVEYHRNNKLALHTTYRGEKVTSTFSLSNVLEMRGCFDATMGQILPKIQSDLCQHN